MATITVRNISNTARTLRDLYVTLPPGGVVTIQRTPVELGAMRGIQEYLAASWISVTVELGPGEVASDLVTVWPAGSAWRPDVATVDALPVGANSVGDVRLVRATQVLYGWTGSAWVPVAGGGGGGSVPDYTQRVTQQTTIAVEGQLSFFAGWDAYVEPRDIVSVTRNGVPVAYTPMVRQNGNWPMVSTASITRGVILAAPASAGDVVGVTAVRRLLHLAAPEPRVIHAPGGIIPDPGGPNLRITFSYANPNVPNALVVDKVAGLQLEVWRLSRRKGMVRTAPIGDLQRVRSGRHWSPWWRSATATESGPLVIDPITSGWVVTPGARAQNRQVYKLAYFDPTTGARTVLSTLSIHTIFTGRADRVRTVGTVHPGPSVWVR